ncbi:hypothetical protein [Methyloglobulus sp.]|uniref:hypothetical protein n=1 Tax=Methyloglobulus sp. TaxID=2518622 RepID=UPI0039890B81
MSDKDKGRFIDDAIARDDANALAAILNYPYALIGWPKERRDNYRDMFIGKTAATEQYAELAETEEAVGTMLGVAAGLCAV